MEDIIGKVRLQMKIQLPTKNAKKIMLQGMGPRVLSYNSDAVKTCEAFTRRKKMWHFLFKPFFKCASFNKIQPKENQPIRHPVPQIPSPASHLTVYPSGASQFFTSDFVGRESGPAGFVQPTGFLVVVVICLGFWGEEDGRDHQEIFGT